MIHYLLGAVFVALSGGVYWLFLLAWPMETQPRKKPEKRYGIQLTRAAADQFREFAAEHNDGTLLRLKVLRAEGGGYIYDANTVASSDPDDAQFESHGVTVVVDPWSLDMLDGTILDWRTNARGEAGFFFDNPNADPMKSRSA